MADQWRTPETDALVDVILRLDDRDDAERFLRDLCTLGELRDMAQRWAVVRLLDEGLHYAEISKRTGASTATITRIASWLNHGEDGYRRALARLKDGASTMRERLRLAIPNKGRLLESTLALLKDAGLVFEAHDRSLVSRVDNHPLDILFVRTNDVVEFVADGVADAGITGGDILAESGVAAAEAPRPRLRPLPADRRGAGRRAVRRDHGPQRGARRDLASERDPGVLRRPGHPGGRDHALGRRRGRPAPWASPTRSSTSCRRARRSR